MIADITAVREAIDRMTPDLRQDMPQDATDLGNRLFSMYLAGIASFLDQNDMPWAEIGINEELRHRVAFGIRSDAMRVYYGLPDDGPATP